jgi:hypothetical protein
MGLIGQRIAHLREINGHWSFKVAAGVWFLFGVATAIRDNFLPAEAQKRFVTLAWLPKWAWYSWVIGLLVIFIFMLLEGSYQSAQKRQPVGAVDARTKKEIYKIDWLYLPASPLEHGWTLAYQGIPAPTVTFLAPTDSPEVGGLQLLVTGGNTNYAIDFKVPTDYAAVDELVIALKYGQGAMFWVEVNITSLDGVSKRKSHFLKILVGDKPPELPPKWPDEALIWLIPDPLANNWSSFRLRLTDIVTKVLGSHGYVYESVKSVRLRGCISVSPIKFLSTVPSQPTVRRLV